MFVPALKKIRHCHFDERSEEKSLLLWELKDFSPALAGSKWQNKMISTQRSHQAHRE